MKDIRLQALQNIAKRKATYKRNVPSKSAAYTYFKAKINHKKLPVFKSNTSRDDAFRNMSIKDYEKQYA